jgi:hypothetical protein
MITFQVESWVDYYNDPERENLWQEHYDDLQLAHENKMEMSPDIPGYERIEAAGQLIILTARKNGKLIGYSLAMVRRHLHYNALCGFEDSYFVTRSERGAGTGLVSAGTGLIVKMLKLLKQRGCVRAYFMTKEFASIAQIFSRLDGKKMDEVWVFWLGN